MSENDGYPYEVRDPQRSAEWTTIDGTFSAWASVRAFLKLKGYRPRQFVDAPHVFEVRHPFTNPDAIHEVCVSVPLRTETQVRHHGADRWTRVGKPAPSPEEQALRDEVLAFVRDVATDYDHDESAHVHANGACRRCNAEKLLAKLEGRAP